MNISNEIKSESGSRDCFISIFSLAFSRTASTELWLLTARRTRYTHCVPSLPHHLTRHVVNKSPAARSTWIKYNILQRKHSVAGTRWERRSGVTTKRRTHENMRYRKRARMLPNFYWVFLFILFFTLSFPPNRLAFTFHRWKKFLQVKEEMGKKRIENKNKNEKPWRTENRQCEKKVKPRGASTHSKK